MRTKILILFLLVYFCSCATQSSLSPAEEQDRKARAEVLLKRATMLMVRGDDDSLRSATSALELARDLVGEQADILDALGCVEWRRGSKDFAVYYFKKALESDRDFAPAYSHLAFVAHENGDLEAAELLYRQSLGLDPSDLQTRNNYAALLLAEGKSLSARNELLKAMQISGAVSPAGAPIFYNLESFSN